MAVDIIARGMAASRPVGPGESDVPVHIKNITIDEINKWNTVTHPILIDAVQLGFDIEAARNGGSSIAINEGNIEIFDSLRNADYNTNVYLVLENFIVKLEHKDQNGAGLIFHAFAHLNEIELEINDNMATFIVDDVMATEDNKGFVKVQTFNGKDNSFASIDSDGYIRYNQLKITEGNVSKDTVLSSYDAINRMACFSNYTGKSVTFFPIDGYPMELMIDITPLQLGEGVPCLHNLRPINGTNNIIINHSNGLGDDVFTKELGRTVFGGYYENTTGDLIITMESAVFNGSENWQVKEIPNGRKSMFILKGGFVEGNLNVAKQLCSRFKCNTTSQSFSSADSVWIAGDTLYVGGALAEQYGYDLNQWKATLQEQPMQIVYEINTPEVVTISGMTIYTRYGENTVTTSTSNLNATVPVTECATKEFVLEEINKLKEELRKAGTL